MKFRYRDYVTIINNEFFKGHGAVLTDCFPYYKNQDVAGYQYEVTFNDGKTKLVNEEELELLTQRYIVPNEIQVHSPNGAIFVTNTTGNTTT